MMNAPNVSASSQMNIAIQFWSFTLCPTGEIFHSVTIEDILSNVRFLAKFDLHAFANQHASIAT